MFQRAAIFSLNILKQVMLCPEYKPSKHDNLSGVGKSIISVSKGIVVNYIFKGKSPISTLQEVQPKTPKAKNERFSTILPS